MNEKNIYIGINPDIIADNARDIMAAARQMAYEEGVSQEAAAMAYLTAALVDLEAVLIQKRAHNEE